MTMQITNIIDTGIVYEQIVEILEKLHGRITVVITTVLWTQKPNVTTVTVNNPEDATKIQQFLRQEIGNKRISVEIS